VRVSSLDLSLVPCLHLGVALGCALVSGVLVSAEGEGVDRPREDGALLWAVGARAGVEVPLSDWAYLRVHADASVPLRGVSLELDGEEVWTTPRVAARGGLGLLAVHR
jgi:hypothetical protein